MNQRPAGRSPAGGQSAESLAFKCSAQTTPISCHRKHFVVLARTKISAEQLASGKWHVNRRISSYFPFKLATHNTSNLIMAVCFIDLATILYWLADYRVDVRTGILIWLQSEELNNPTRILWRGAGSWESRGRVENVTGSIRWEKKRLPLKLTGSSLRYSWLAHDSVAANHTITRHVWHSFFGGDSQLLRKVSH